VLDASWTLVENMLSSLVKEPVLVL